MEMGEVDFFLTSARSATVLYANFTDLGAIVAFMTHAAHSS